MTLHCYKDVSPDGLAHLFCRKPLVFKVLFEAARALFNPACPMFGTARALFDPATQLLEAASGLFDPASALLHPACPLLDAVRSLFEPTTRLLQTGSALLETGSAWLEPAKGFSETGRALHKTGGLFRRRWRRDVANAFQAFETGRPFFLAAARSEICR